MPELAPVPECYGFTIFCDDVRYEQGNKVSYIGTYRGLLRIQGTFPAALPKFVLVVRFNQNVEAYEPDLPVWIFLPGDDLEKPSIVGQLPNAPDIGQPQGPIVSIEAHFAISPFVIAMPGSILVRVLRRGRLERLGSIKIEFVPPDAPVTVGDIVAAPT